MLFVGMGDGAVLVLSGDPVLLRTFVAFGSYSSCADRCEVAPGWMD